MTSLFTTQLPAVVDATDNSAYELGTRFVSTQEGRITHIKFYKALSEAGTHIGRIWSSAGVLLGSATFLAESASGWQIVALSAPVTIQVGNAYVVSVNINSHYVYTINGLASVISNPPLQTLTPNNGVFSTTAAQFPTLSSNNSNYFVDVVYTPLNVNIPGTLSVYGIAQQGHMLTAVIDDSDGLIPSNATYSWERSLNLTTWTTIVGATQNHYLLTGTDVAHHIRAKATYTDLGGTIENVISIHSAAVNPIPEPPPPPQPEPILPKNYFGLFQIDPELLLDKPLYPQGMDFVDEDCKFIAEYLYAGLNDTFYNSLRTNIVKTVRYFNDLFIPVTDFPVLKVYKIAIEDSIHLNPQAVTKFNISYALAYTQRTKIASVGSYVADEIARLLKNASYSEMFQLDDASGIQTNFQDFISPENVIYKYVNVVVGIYTM